MTLELYTELRQNIESRLDKADDILKSFPTNETGLVKMTDEFRAAKKRFDSIFNQLRTLNKHTPNKILYTYSMNRRSSMLAKNK